MADTWQNEQPANCCYLCAECSHAFNSAEELESHMLNHKSDLSVDKGSTQTSTSPSSELSEAEAVELKDGSGDDIVDALKLNESLPELDAVDDCDSEDMLHGGGSNGSSFCRLCFKTFPSRSLLNVHYTHTHRDKPQYECEYCGQVYTVKRELATHRRIHSGEPLHACGICGKVFGTKQLLKKHYVWHTGNRDFVCPKCGKAFYQKGHLTQHMMIHTGGRPHVCKLCSKTFIFKFDLNRHLKIHAERGQSCMYCGEGFDQSETLLEHIKLCIKKRKHTLDDESTKGPKRSRRRGSAPQTTFGLSPNGSTKSRNTLEMHLKDELLDDYDDRYSSLEDSGISNYKQEHCGISEASLAAAHNKHRGLSIDLGSLESGSLVAVRPSSRPNVSPPELTRPLVVCDNPIALASNGSHLSASMFNNAFAAVSSSATAAGTSTGLFSAANFQTLNLLAATYGSNLFSTAAAFNAAAQLGVNKPKLEADVYCPHRDTLKSSIKLDAGDLRTGSNSATGFGNIIESVSDVDDDSESLEAIPFKLSSSALQPNSVISLADESEDQSCDMSYCNEDDDDDDIIDEGQFSHGQSDQSLVVIDSNIDGSVRTPKDGVLIPNEGNCIGCAQSTTELTLAQQRILTLEQELATAQSSDARSRMELSAKEHELIRLRDRMTRVGSMASSLVEMCSDFDKAWMLHSKKVYNQMQSLLNAVD